MRKTDLLTSLTLALPLVACGPGPRVASIDSTSPPQGSPAPSRDACNDLAMEVCLELGQESLTCRHLRASIEFFSGDACELSRGTMRQRLDDIRKTQPPCEMLMTRLCEDIGRATASCATIRKLWESLTNERCSVMMGQYPAVLSEVQRMAAWTEPLSQELQNQIAAGDAPTLGNGDATIPLVVFSDFTGLFCAKAAEAITKALEEDGRNVKVVFRHFPAADNEEAMTAALAADAAFQQGKFWEYSELLFSAPNPDGKDRYLDYARRLNLDMARFKRDRESRTSRQRIEHDLELAKAVRAQGAPWIILDGQQVMDPTDSEELIRRIQATSALRPSPEEHERKQRPGGNLAE